MSALTLVIASPEIITLAADWARVGLVARSYWIGHEQALAADPDDGIPLAKAKVISPDAGEREVEFAPALAAEQRLTALRVVWVRKPGDTDEMAVAMGRAEASIRRLIPQHGLEPTFVELLVPQTLRDLEIPMPPADWQQIVVEPVDRPDPAGSDSHWGDKDTPPRQGLHAALMIGGILGGSNLNQPAPLDAKTDAPWVVHPFTRAIRGADRARRKTLATLSERLTTISGADVAPDLYFAPEPPEDSEYIDEAARWVRSLDDEALQFRRPTISFKRRGQSFTEFLLEVLRFLGWALNGMFGIPRWKDLILVIRARIARRLEAEDYGATIDPDAPTPAGLDLDDYDALEADAQAEAETRISHSARADGRVPDRLVWAGLARLVPSLIDGSAPPREWTPRTRFDHTFVLAPQAVIRTEPKVLDSAAGGRVGFPAQDELRGVKRIGEDELARAIELARAGLEDDLVRFESPTGRVTKTAQAIAEQAQAEDAEQRKVFAQSLGEGAAVDHTTVVPLLSRVRASVVSDLLLARFAAEHLAAMTKTTVPNSLSKLQRMLRDGTWIVLGTLLVGVGLIAFLARFSSEIDAVFTAMQVPYPTSWTQIVGWIISATVGVLIFIFTRLFYAYHAYNEIGRRRLEYVERRAAAAIAAYDERNRLRNAERILSAWEDVLSSIATRDDDEQPPLADVPGDLPDALQVAEPDVADDELARLVIQDAIEPGWFGDALTKLVDSVLNTDEQERIWADPGMPGGPLARLRSSAVEGRFQRDWWETWVSRTADKVVAKLAVDTTPVRPLATRRDGSLAAEEFHAEITRQMSPEYRPGSDYQELFDAREDGRRMVVSARQTSRDFQLTPALTAIDTVLVFRRLGRMADEQHDGDQADAETEIGRA